MTEADLNEALRLAGPGHYFEQPTDHDWRRVEDEFGIRLPRTYKTFVSGFGSGVFGVDLYVLNPAASDENVRFGKPWLANEVGLIESHLKRLPRRYFDGVDGLLPVASTTSQLDFAFNVRNRAVLDEVTIVHLGIRELDDTGLSLCQLILKIYQSNEHWAKGLRDCLWGDPPEAFFQSRSPASQRVPCVPMNASAGKAEPDSATLGLLKKRALEQILAAEPSAKVDRYSVQTFHGVYGWVVAFTFHGTRGDETPMRFEYQFLDREGEWITDWKFVQCAQDGGWQSREG